MARAPHGLGPTAGDIAAGVVLLALATTAPLDAPELYSVWGACDPPGPGLPRACLWCPVLQAVLEGGGQRVPRLHPWGPQPHPGQQRRGCRVRSLRAPGNKGCDSPLHGVKWGLWGASVGVGVSGVGSGERGCKGDEGGGSSLSGVGNAGVSDVWVGEGGDLERMGQWRWGSPPNEVVKGRSPVDPGAMKAGVSDA